jgi:hypothetical protein
MNRRWIALVLALVSLSSIPAHATDIDVHVRDGPSGVTVDHFVTVGGPPVTFTDPAWTTGVNQRHVDVTIVDQGADYCSGGGGCPEGPARRYEITTANGGGYFGFGGLAYTVSGYMPGTICECIPANAVNGNYVFTQCCNSRLWILEGTCSAAGFGLSDGTHSVKVLDPTVPLPPWALALLALGLGVLGYFGLRTLRREPSAHFA